MSHTAPLAGETKPCRIGGLLAAGRSDGAKRPSGVLAASAIADRALRALAAAILTLRVKTPPNGPILQRRAQRVDRPAWAKFSAAAENLAPQCVG